MSLAVTFNGNNINDDSTYVLNIASHRSSTPFSRNAYKFARSSGSKLISRVYGEKTITLSGKIIGTSRENLDSNIDSLKLKLSGQEKNLDIEYASSTRRYIATLASEVKIDPQNVTFANWQADFVCHKGYGQDTSTTTESFSSLTSSTETDDIDIAGTFPAKPTITITIASLTGGTDKYVQFKNADTGEYVKIERTWTGGDVIIINSENNTVTVNGTDTDFLGTIPDEWGPGVTNWEYSDDLTTRSASIDITYTALYL